MLPFADGKPGNPIRVTRQDGTALKFSNKPEGVEVWTTSRYWSYTTMTVSKWEHRTLASNEVTASSAIA